MNPMTANLPTQEEFIKTLSNLKAQREEQIHAAVFAYIQAGKQGRDMYSAMAAAIDAALSKEPPAEEQK